jgi:hypothetical protein
MRTDRIATAIRCGLKLFRGQLRAAAPRCKMPVWVRGVQTPASAGRGRLRRTSVAQEHASPPRIPSGNDPLPQLCPGLQHARARQPPALDDSLPAGAAPAASAVRGCFTKARLLKPLAAAPPSARVPPLPRDGVERLWLHHRPGCPGGAAPSPGTCVAAPLAAAPGITACGCARG